MMFDDPAIILKDQVNEPASYMSILGAISNGATAVSKISSRVEIPVTSLNPYLRKLRTRG